MDLQVIKQGLSSLSEAERLELLKELEQLSSNSVATPKSEESRGHLLDNKLGCCAYCSHPKYVKFGIDKGELTTLAWTSRCEI